MHMKKKNLLFLLLLLMPLSGQAQSTDDLNENKNDWKFAAGVTVYSNNHYISFQNVLERQPLEFNFRYIFRERHVLRVSLPIIYKSNKHGEPEIHITPDGNVFRPNSLEAYLQSLRDKEWDYAHYTKPLHYYESLYGVSIGYDYDYFLGNNISAFGGINTAYYRSSVDSKYYSVSYASLDEESKSEFSYITLNNNNLTYSAFTVTPLLGLRYNFQKLLFEANLGYSFLRLNSAFNMNLRSIDPFMEKVTEKGQSGKMKPINGNYLLYNFSIYYTF